MFPGKNGGALALQYKGKPARMFSEYKPSASQQRFISAAAGASADSGLPSSHGATLSRGGHILQVGINSPFTPEGLLPCSLHAEMDVLMRIRVDGEFLRRK